MAVPLPPISLASTDQSPIQATTDVISRTGAINFNNGNGVPNWLAGLAVVAVLALLAYVAYLQFGG